MSKRGHTHIISIGGADIDGRPHNKVICISGHTYDFPGLPIGVKNHCALTLGDFVYCIGGQEERFHDYVGSKRVWRINIKTCSDDMEWKNTAPMNVGRTQFGAAVYTMNGEQGIIVAGGCSEAGATAEFYSPSRNIWKLLDQRLQMPRYGHAMVNFNGDVYALGGKDDDGTVLDTIEEFNVNGWQITTSKIKRPRYLFAAVCYDEDIYAIGGWNARKTALQSVESVFGKGEWFMKSGRCKHAACAFNDRVIVVGGLTNIVVNRRFKRLRTTEQFNGQVWMEEHEIENELFRHAIVSM